MRIIYDWKLARVIDDDGEIIDELYWNRISTKALVNRLSDLQSGIYIMGLETKDGQMVFQRFIKL